MDYKYKLNYKELGQRIAKERKNKNLTQSQLAELIDISTNAVSKLEINLMTISLSTLINIANVLNLDINYLLFSEAATEQKKTSVDVYLDSLVKNLNQKEKEFLIHIINGLKAYKE